MHMHIHVQIHGLLHLIANSIFPQVFFWLVFVSFAIFIFIVYKKLRGVIIKGGDYSNSAPPRPNPSGPSPASWF